jgi:hypothetical protein
VDGANRACRRCNPEEIWLADDTQIAHGGHAEIASRVRLPQKSALARRSRNTFGRHRRRHASVDVDVHKAVLEEPACTAID